MEFHVFLYVINRLVAFAAKRDGNFRCVYCFFFSAKNVFKISLDMVLYVCYFIAYMDYIHHLRFDSFFGFLLKTSDINLISFGTAADFFFFN